MDVIEVNRKRLEKIKEVQVIEDIIVPDVKPDIVSIIDISNICYAYKIEKTAGKIKLDGNVDCYIMYVSSDGDTRGLQSTFNFSDILEANEITENVIVKYKLDSSKIESKILNERKINITCNLNIDYEIYERQKIDIYNEFENIEGLEMQSDKKNMASVVGINTGKASVKQDLKIDNIDKIAEILKFDINIKNKETKISYNKILAKAEAEVCVMYLTEDNRISKANSDFQLMSFIDIENVKEDNICNIEYNLKNMFLKVNSVEENSITCQLDFDLLAEVYEEKEIQIVSDLYSLKSDVEFSLKELDIDNLSKDLQNSIEVTEKVEVQEIKNVLDIEAKGKIIKNNVTPENSNIEGEIELKIYYESTQKMGVNVKTITVPFISKISKLEGDIRVLVNKKEFDLENTEVIVKLSLNVFAKNSNKQKISIVENVTTKELVNPNDYSMVVYFVKPNDTLWKIAKCFKVTVNSLVESNSIENPDIIYPGEKLYIVK